MSHACPAIKHRFGTGAERFILHPAEPNAPAERAACIEVITSMAICYTSNATDVGVAGLRIKIDHHQRIETDDTQMTNRYNSRRNFLTGAGRSLIAVGAVAGLGLSANVTRAAQSCAAQSKATQKAITPQMALQMLKDGNARFVQGKMLKCDYIQQVKATGDGQYAFAAVVGCIDSRASNELIFDQGIGDIFSARVAGNFVNDDMLGSLEFACAVTGAKLIVVAGHTECGAIKGACDDVVLGNLTQTLANIKPAVAAVSGFEANRTSGNYAFVQAVADKNVELTIARIRARSVILRGMADKGEIGLAGCMYDVHTGRVRFT